MDPPTRWKEINGHPPLLIHFFFTSFLPSMSGGTWMLSTFFVFCPRQEYTYPRFRGKKIKIRELCRP